jgi:hypothetical protein
VTVTHTRTCIHDHHHRKNQIKTTTEGDEHYPLRQAQSYSKVMSYITGNEIKFGDTKRGNQK